MKYSFSDFILHILKKFKFKFYHSTERHTFSFWPYYTRYAMLVIDKLPVEFFLLMSLSHLPLETTNRFIYPRHFFTILLSLYIFFIMNIRQFITFLVCCFQVLPEIVVNFIKKNIFHFISFHIFVFSSAFSLQCVLGDSSLITYQLLSQALFCWLNCSGLQCTLHCNVMCCSTIQCSFQSFHFSLLTFLIFLFYSVSGHSLYIQIPVLNI